MVDGVGPLDNIRRRINGAHIPDKIRIVDPHYKQCGGPIRRFVKVIDVRSQVGAVLTVVRPVVG